MLLCVATLKRFSALSELEEGVPEAGQGIFLLPWKVTSNRHSDTLSVSIKVGRESLGPPEATTG